MLCGAMAGKDLIVSARTSGETDNAAKLLQKTLDGLGFCGGHVHRAGGKIPGMAVRTKIAEELENDLRSRWLTACGIDRQRGTRLGGPPRDRRESPISAGLSKFPVDRSWGPRDKFSLRLGRFPRRRGEQARFFCRVDGPGKLRRTACREKPRSPRSTAGLR